jgi:ribosome biogenesis protein Nip4
MKDAIKFRIINEIEKKLINSTLVKILSQPNNFMMKLCMLFTEDKYPSIYSVSDKLDQELQNFTNYDVLISTGLYFGFIKRGVFFISLEATEYLYKNNQLSENLFLIVNKEGEKRVLYGNDVYKKFVIKEAGDLNEGDFLVVLNENLELLAIGLSEINSTDFQSLSQERKIAKTLRDKGSYLRRKQ